MKTLKLLAAFMLLTSAAKTQINKGQFLVGGNINFESFKNEGANVANYKSTTFSFSPNIGYFIINKLAGGLRIDIQTMKLEYSNADQTSTNASVSPFVRYYFLPEKKMINAFIDVSYINSRTKFTNSTTSAESIEKFNGYLISAGPSVFLSDYIALEFTLGFKHTTMKNYINKSSIITSGLGLQVHLGKLKTKLRI